MSGILNTKWYDPNRVYSDGAVEQEIFIRLKAGANGDDLMKEDDRWPILYHFSPVRQNIVQWLPINPDAHVLEIGSAMGAISGALARKAEHLTCVDFSMLRSQINQLRYPDAENMEIIVANFNDISFYRTFDVVTLIGVLEYAGRYTNGDNPYRDFLNKSLSLVSRGGSLVIAIENRMGLRYFAGAKEDHNEVVYQGLNGYPGDAEIRTFSLKEIQNLLSQTNCTGYDIYLPLPDYKFPTTIVASDASEFFSEAVTEEKNYGAYIHTPFDQTRVFQTLIDQKMFAEFANSFLIIAHK